MKRFISLPLTILMLLCVLAACNPNAEEVDWANIKLGHILPEPQSNLMNVISNGEDNLLVYIHKVSMNNYLEYQRWCENDKGFNVEAETIGTSFYAYNQEGYYLSLYYSDTQDEMHITVDAPIPMEKFELPEYAAVAGLPVPSSSIGYYNWENTDSFFLYVGETSKDDYMRYKDACVAAGFTKEPYEYNTVYSATNGAGYNVSLNYKGFNTFTLEFHSPDDSNENAPESDAPNNNASENTLDYNDVASVENDGVSRNAKNGFDSSSNETYILAGYTVDVPKYWGSENNISGGVQRYAETGGKVAMLQIYAQAESDNDYPVTFDGLMDDNNNMIAMIESTVFEEVTDYEVVDTGIIKGILYKGTILEKESGLTGYAEWFTFASEEDRTWCTLVLCQTDNTEYSYTDDFMKIIKSIKPKEQGNQNLPTPDIQPAEISLAMGAEDFKGMNYQEAEKVLREIGFTEFEYSAVDTENESVNDTICAIEITEWIFGDSDFVEGDKFSADATVTLFTYKYKAPPIPEPVFYSTNDYETAKKGNTGVFSYRERGSSYDIYWIIDFDEGCVYYFTDGNGESSCDRLKIDSGTLNDAVTITYHDSGDTWSYRLHFKYVNHPETLIMVDQNGFDWKYSTTDLDNALAIRATKRVKDY